MRKKHSISPESIRLVKHKDGAIDHTKTGQAVKEARTELGVSQRAIARRLKQSSTYISDLEAGTRKWTEEKLAGWKIAMLDEIASREQVHA